jgi:uncharacterized membrane protein YfcA
LKSLIIVLNILEASAFVSSIIYWRKIRNTYWRWFSFYLLFIVISEAIGAYLATRETNTLNNAFFNYFEIPMEFLFFFWLFSRSFKKTKYSWLPVVCSGVYVLSWVLDIIYFNKMRFIFYSLSYTVGNLLLLVLILQFFIRLVMSDEILTFRKNMLFWVSSGLLLFYLGSFPYYGLRNTIAYNYQDIYTTYSYIAYILNCFMYLMFIFSFVWGKPNLRSSSF